MASSTWAGYLIETRAEREALYAAEEAEREAIEARDREDDASIARCREWKRLGVSDEECEIREEAFLAARQRSIDFVNAEVSRIFAVAAPQPRYAEIGNGLFVKVGTGRKRRAA